MRQLRKKRSVCQHHWVVYLNGKTLLLLRGFSRASHALLIVAAYAKNYALVVKEVWANTDNNVYERTIVVEKEISEDPAVVMERIAKWAEFSLHSDPGGTRFVAPSCLRWHIIRTITELGRQIRLNLAGSEKCWKAKINETWRLRNRRNMRIGYSRVRAFVLSRILYATARSRSSVFGAQVTNQWRKAIVFQNAYELCSDIPWHTHPVRTSLRLLKLSHARARMIWTFPKFYLRYFFYSYEAPFLWSSCINSASENQVKPLALQHLAVYC